MKSSITVILLFISFISLGQKMKQPDLEGDLLVDVGMNYMFNSPDSLRNNTWGSNSIGIYYNRRFRISDHLSFVPAIGVTMEKYRFKGDNTWRYDEVGTVALDTSGIIGLIKNKLTATYVDIPLELRIYPGGTVDGEGFFIGLGVVGGVKLESHTKIAYKIGKAKTKDKLYNSFGLSDFRYGVQGRIGFRAIHAFYKFYLSDVFRQAPLDRGNLGQVMTFGINFSGF